MQKQNHIRVAVGILRRDEEVLLCQRKRTAKFGLQWEFPGGKVEAGETDEECLRRELREELSVELENVSPYDSEEMSYSDHGDFAVVFFTASPSGEFINNVFEDIRWVPIKQLPEYNNLSGNKRIVERLLHDYGSEKTSA